MSAPSKVYETADDAAVSKLSAARAGYFVDPFLGLFVRAARAQRRSPLINRGYFARLLAVDTIVRRFLSVCCARGEGARAQIISLGAGFDTAFFRLAVEAGDCAGKGAPAPASTGLYVEVDFPDVTVRKAALIARHAPLLKAVAGGVLDAADVACCETAAAASAPGNGGGETAPAPALPEGVTVSPAGGGVSLCGPAYRLVTADLRDVASLQASLRGAGVDFSAPTLLLSECVLVYLEPQESCAIIAWAAQAFERSVFATYEQIRPHDAFGQIMARNLAERGYSLRGLVAFPDLDSQRRRYLELGYGSVSVADMNDVYYRLLSPEAVARAERLELFDEVEEWHLMSAHYCIAVACKEGATGAPGHRTSTSSPAPSAVAAAVVHAHEASVAAIGARARSRSRGSSVSDDGAPPTLLSASSHDCASGSGSSVAPNILPPDLRAAADAIGEAAGTSVESVELAHESSSVFPSPLASPTASTPVGNADARSVAAEADLAPTAASSAASVPATVAAAAATATGAEASQTTLRTLHTHAGDVVISSHAAVAVDFEGIAEAQAEMRAAGGLREATGLNLSLQRGRAASTEARSSTDVAVVDAGPVGPAWLAARTREAAASSERTHGYALDALRARGAAVSLHDVLFPTSPTR